ncbi:MAG: tail fiber domain-containing protein, partial [Alphaproteobacteria bacterium]|nr:tail fiber domain-containing protein [Alphaproteobacteria bacterium]
QRPGTPVNGMVRYNTSTPGFEVYEAGAWVAMGSAASDIRLKKDLKKLGSAEILERLSHVQGYSYSLKEGTGERRYGVVAQELERIFPELVDSPENQDEMKSVRYQEFSALLIEAVKELKNENEILKTDLAKAEQAQKDMHTALNNLRLDVDGLKVHTGYGISKAEMGLWMLLAMIGGSLLVFAFGATRRKS